MAKKENEKLKLLLEERPDIVKMRGSYSRSPFIHAARENNPEILKVLLEYGETFDGRSGNGSTALHSAVRKDSRECITWLLENHPLLLNVQDKFGDTPLHVAAFYDRLTSLKLMLNQGAAIDTKNNRGETPLEYASKRHNEGCIEELQKGLDRD